VIRAQTAATPARTRAWSAARWLPGLTAAAYLVTAAVMGTRIAGELGWDTDVSGPLVLAEKLRGDGTVYLPHISAWTTLWYALATRNLPGHVQLWQATGYVFAVAGAALVGWATARVTTRSAGVTAFAITLIVGPLALRTLFTLHLHVTTPFTAAVLAALLIALDRPYAGVAAGAVGVLAGLNVASDPLLWPAGIVPFASASAVLVALTRRRDVAARAGLALALTVCTAMSVNVVMHSLGYHELGAGQHFSTLHEFPGHLRLLARMVALLGGANYALPGPYPVEPVRAVVALLVLVAVVAPVVAAATYFKRRTSPLARAYACYWAVSTVVVAIAFVVTSNAADLGAGSFNYLLTFAPAAGAGIGLLSSAAPRGRLLVAAGVALVGVTNIVGVGQGHAGTPRGEIGTHERPLVQWLVDRGVTRGYAGYWDAQNLTWQSGMRVFVAPVTTCSANKPLCVVRIFSIQSWYRERPGRSFLIVDPTNGYVTTAPRFVARATESHRFGRLRIYLFPFDLARYVGSA
jgi:hypothetical protein